MEVQISLCKEEMWRLKRLFNRKYMMNFLFKVIMWVFIFSLLLSLTWLFIEIKNIIVFNTVLTYSSILTIIWLFISLRSSETSSFERGEIKKDTKEILEKINDPLKTKSIKKVTSYVHQWVYQLPDLKDFSSWNEVWWDWAQKREKSRKVFKEKNKLAVMRIPFEIHNQTDNQIDKIKLRINRNTQTYKLKKTTSSKKNYHKFRVISAYYIQAAWKIENTTTPIERLMNRYKFEDIMVATLLPNERLEFDLIRITDKYFFTKPRLELTYSDHNWKSIQV